MRQVLLKYIIIFFLCIEGFSSVRAQDPLFSQFYANPLYLNPAFAGSQICPRIVGNFRDQWPSIPGQYITFSGSYDQHFDQLSGGLGFQVMNDRAGGGSYSMTSVSGIYSYRLNFNDDFSIRAAAKVSFLNHHVDWSNLTFPDQYDERLGFLNRPTQENISLDPQSRSTADFGVGIVGYAESFFAGFSVDHLTQPDWGFSSTYKLPMKFTMHAGVTIDVQQKRSPYRDEKSITISPNILYQQQGTSNQLNYGLYVNFSPFVLGAWFRQNFKQADALVFLAGLQHNSLKVGYSYDLTLSELRGSTGGAHEISVGFLLPCPEKKHKVKVINCPKF